MFAFVKCVGQAAVELGLRGLVGLLPGGEFACKLAEKSFEKYRAAKRDQALRDDVQKMAAATFEEAKAAAVQVVREIAASAPPQDQLNLELFLTQIPAAVQASLKRPDDPTGRSVPPQFAVNSPDDVLKMTPPRLPRFRPGDALPGGGGWVLTDMLGLGGFGEVWLARFGQFGSTAHRGAVKFFHGLNTRDLEHELNLVARVMQATGTFPGVVPLVAQNLTADPPWVMYEYVAGGDLAGCVREWARLDAASRTQKAVAALRGLAETVGTLHRLSPAVVHRDLKPTNILYDAAAGRFRVTDFGIGGVVSSAALKAERTGESTRGGRLLSYLRGSHTPLYSSPQQRDGSDPDPRDDVHALGVIGYQLVTGHLSQGVGTDFDDDLKEAGASDELICVLKKCTAQKADRRWPSAVELAAAIAELDRSAPATPAPPQGETAEEMFRKGKQYSSGRGVTQDYAEAMRWYHRAADLGHAAAQNDIGFHYHNGWGVAQDYTEAMRWYRKAADQGDSGAQNNIGVLYLLGNCGVAQDYAEAMRWCAKSADLGNGSGQNQVGWMYAKGLGVPQDFAEAMRWYRKAADQGFAGAQSNIGTLYANGQGVAQDTRTAIEWFRKAAAQGDQGAKVWLKHLGAS